MLTGNADGRLPVILAIVALLSACTSPLSPSVAATAAPKNQTGLTELDAIIAAALAGDVRDLRQLFAYTQTMCTFAEGLSGPPKCRPDDEEGSPVEVLPFLGPEGHFIRKADMDSWTGLEVSGLFAAYQVLDSAYSDQDYPAGEYALVFAGSPEAPTSITLQVRHGRIVRIDFGSDDPPVIRPEDVAKYLVPPRQD